MQGPGEQDHADTVRRTGLALFRDRNDGLAWLDRGVALHGLGRDGEALECHRAAAALLPPHPGIAANIANILYRLGDHAGMLAAARDGLRAFPDHSDLLGLAGAACHALADLDQAIGYFSRCLALDPANARDGYNLSACLLEQGRYPEGWRHFHHRRSRFNPHDRRTEQRFAALPAWDGGNVEMLMVHGEQGFGDMIMFARFLRLLPDHCRQVRLFVPPALVRLLALAFPAIGVAGFDRFDPADCPAGTRRISLLDLPALFGLTLADVTPPGPYLHPPATATQRRGGIALVWAGGRDTPSDAVRSLAPDLLAPIMGLGLPVLGINPGSNAAEIARLSAMGDFRQLVSPGEDFLATAGHLAGLDLLISVDSAPAHLAGALGLPVWTLLPWRTPDWRWLLNRSDSPWYPGMRLYRQPAPGDWQSVIATVTRDLAALRP